jgi:hypothetical protein
MLSHLPKSTKASDLPRLLEIPPLHAINLVPQSIFHRVACEEGIDMESESFQRLAQACNTALSELLQALDEQRPLEAAGTSGSRPPSPTIDADSIKSLQARFSQWASNLGALQPPTSPKSLESRLRTALMIADHIKSLLRDFSSAVTRCELVLDLRGIC